MPMTMTQKILAAHCGRDNLRAGELINAGLDLVMANDITAPVAINAFRGCGLSGVFNPDKIALVMDHFAPNKDILSAENVRQCREFAAQNGIGHYFEVGTMGIEHALLPEQGLINAGDCVIGADSHTCTYGALGAFSTGVGSTDMAAAMATGLCWFKVPAAIRVNLTGTLRPDCCGKDVILRLIGTLGVDGANYMSLEFGGEGLSCLNMDDRFTVANMAVEAGAKNGIFEVDGQTENYLAQRVKRPARKFSADPDSYERTVELNLSDIVPTVAKPHLPSNVAPACELGDVKIDQVVIGSCTNGRISDLRAAAAQLKGKKVAQGLRAIVIPATQSIYLQALREGLIEIFITAGCAVSTPTCGPCLGGHMGVLAKGERCLATTNRNFVGRMGDPESEVWLASPATAAASAVAGRIVPPQAQ